MAWQGYWDAFTNSPFIQDGVGSVGDLYSVSITGTQDLGHGATLFSIGCLITYDSSSQWIIAACPGGGGGGGGTVTSIDITSLAPLISSGGPITSSGVINLNLDTGQGLTLDGSNKLTLDLDSTTIVTVAITTNWTIYKNDGTTPYTTSSSSSKNLVTETGCKVNISSIYQYPTASTGQGLPTSVSGSWGTTLPGAATPSSIFTNSSTQISTNSSFSTTIAKPRSGLIVSGSQVVFPTGSDTSTDSTSVTFYYPIYYGVSALTSLASSNILHLTKSLQATSAKTITGVTTTSSQYYYFCYPSSYPAISHVILNGALDVFGAFTNLGTVATTLDSGVTINMTVLRTNDLGAFTSASLAFS